MLDPKEPNEDLDFPVRNGIEKCEDLCKCGEHLRLHTHVFGCKKGNPEAKYYVDCPKCMITSEWHKTPDEAIEDFDHQAESLEIRVDSVSEPSEV